MMLREAVKLKQLGKISSLSRIMKVPAIIKVISRAFKTPRSCNV